MHGTSKGGHKHTKHNKISEHAWEKDLAGKKVNDDKWSCYCAIIEEAKPFYRIFTNEFENICQYGYRKNVHCISMSNIIEMVWVNKNKGGVSTPLILLCEEVRKFAGKRFEGKIPPNLLAAILKYIILELKERDIRNKEHSMILRNDYLSKLESYKTDTAETKRPKTVKPKTAQPKTVQPKTKNHTVQLEKISSKLHKRGEELKCRMSVKDSPLNGPDLYIFLINFHDVVLPLELFNIGVTLTAIIQLGLSEQIIKGDTNTFRKHAVKCAEKNKEIKKALSETVLSQDVYKESLLMFPDIRQYWMEFYYFYKNIKYYNYFKDLALIEFIPTLLKNPRSMHFVEHLRVDMYNGMVGSMYNLVCIKNMYNTYIQKTNLVNVTDTEKGVLENLNFYNDLLNSFPQDTLTIGLIMDTLVAQVCIEKYDHIGYDIENYSFIIRKENSKTESAKCFDNRMKQLDSENDVSKTDEEEMKEKLLLKSEELGKPKIITVIKEDDITLSSIYLPEERRNFIKERSNHITELFWNQRIWENVNNIYETFPPGFLKPFSDRMANYVKASFGEEIITAFTSLSEIMRSLTPGRDELIDPIYFVQEQVLNDQDSISMSYVENLISQFISGYNERGAELLNTHDVLRIMDRDVLLQKLHKDFISSSCTKFKYFPLLGKILCKFFNAAVPRKTDVMVPSKITLGDFMEGLYYNKIIDLDILNNELRHCNSNFNKDDMQFFDGPGAQELIFPLIINNQSVTYGECIPRQPEYEEFMDDLIVNDTQMADQPKNVIVNGFSEGSIKFDGSFLYDIGIPWKTEYTFSDVELCFNEGLLMKLKYEGMVRENLHLSFLANFKNIHCIHYHTFVFCSANKEDFHNIESKLTVEHSSGMLISFRKEPDVKKKQSKMNSPRDSIPEEGIMETHFGSFDSTSLPFNNFKLFFDLTVSWPSGLVVDFVTLAGLPPYVKQKYLIPHKCSASEIKDEQFRCNLSDGIVIKFKNDGSIMLLYPNGKIVECREFRWSRSDTDIDGPPVGFKLNDTETLSLEMISYRIRFPDGKIEINNKGKRSFEKCIVIVTNDVLRGTCTVECSGDTFVYSGDGVMKVNYSDGTVITSRVIFRSTPIFISEYNHIAGIETEEDKFYENPEEMEMANHEGNIWTKEEEMYNNGFEVVDFDFYKIENSHFVTTVFDLTNEEIIYELPNGVNIKYLDTENINIDLGDEVIIHTEEDKITAKENLNNKLRNNIIFSMDNFENDEEIHQTHCVSYSDELGNKMLIDVTGEIKISKVDNETNDKAIFSECYFIFDENYKGMKFVSTNEMKQILSQINSDNNSIIHKEINDTFMEYLTVTSLNVNEKWILNTNQATACSQNNQISTYGESWSHPFRITPCDNDVFSFIKGISLQLFKKINFGATPSHEFADILNRYYFDFKNNPILIHGIVSIMQRPVALDLLFINEPHSVETLLQKIFDQHYTTCKTTKLTDWAEKNLILPPVLYAVYYARLKRVAKKYFKLKRKILNKQVPPYFESSEGNSYLLTDKMINNALKKNHNKINSCKLDSLLNMDLESVTSKEIEEMKKLLRQDDRGIWDGRCSKYSLEEVLEAGSELNQFFQNMKAVLEFHKSNLSSLNCSDGKE